MTTRDEIKQLIGSSFPYEAYEGTANFLFLRSPRGTILYRVPWSELQTRGPYESNHQLVDVCKLLMKRNFCQVRQIKED